MGARKKKKCQECGDKANMAYDGHGLLCAECLKVMQDEIVTLHRSGKMVYEVAEKKLMERLRLSRHGVEEILHPPLGEGDFQNPAMSMRMSTHIRSIMEASE